ncbi:phosphotransferase enzyme family protein [Aquamicrobium soli]|uniref:Phosphotransferase enzyme family protein n=1 Tax=Aquamicrobium soli TaxID=1811518 RepID=A0ABV7K6A9_9HYPH
MSQEVTLERLHGLVQQSLNRWDVPAGTSARLINISENATYLVEAPNGFRSILRVHRENYHSRDAIASELAWSRALGREGGVETPDYFLGRDGSAIQTATVDGLPAPRHMVMFAFVEGHEPDPDHDLVAPFRQLGQIAARAHLHSSSWRRPAGFQRMTWDESTVFGPTPTWGDWRDGPNIDAGIASQLERLEARIVSRLAKFGKGADRYGLIHADMRLANLLVYKDKPRLIDFDDCGFGWFLYDFATGVSFMEDHPQVPALKKSWVEGYRTVRDLPAADEAEIDTFVMLRRMALLAWIGSHREVEIAIELAPVFAEGTARLAESYFSTHG